MSSVKGLKYSKDQEWVRVEGNKAYMGITNYAQKALGDIVFVELPSTGTEIGVGDPIGVIESVKTASDIYSPVSGTVVEVNEELVDSPEKVNEKPYECWIAAVEMSDETQLAQLMDEEKYLKLYPEEA